jgi:transcription elongation factor Elf1
MYSYRVISWICPECNHKNSLSVTLSESSTDSYIKYCDLDNGGCGKRFVIDVMTDITAKVSPIVESYRT